MAITSDDFLQRYPIFDGATSVENIDNIIADAYYDLDPNVWTDVVIQDRAAMLITAHKLQLERDDAMRQGLVMTAMEEKTSLNYKTYPSDKMYWQQTIYGQEYLNLRKRVVNPSMFVV